MGNEPVLWQCECMVCCEEKPIYPFLIIEQMPICDDCGEWLADGCDGYPQHVILIDEFLDMIAIRGTV